MKKLRTFDFDRRSSSQYDWDRLFDGSPWRVDIADMNRKEGDEDRDVRARFRRTAYAAAQARGLTLQTQSVDNGLVIQASQ